MALAYSKENALNAICPYFTMFPLEYPLRVLKKHKKDNPIVLDPFCGRGTALFAARNLGMNAWGIDSSLVAVTIAKAKLASCNIDTPIKLAEDLIAGTDPIDIPESTFFKHAYYPQTLRDLCALREALLMLSEDSDASVILRAAALGCLHGPLPKNLTNAGYFSNQMPRTYASKPGYAVRYWREKDLKAPKIDVITVLRRKIERLTGLHSTSPNSILQVFQGDSQEADSYSAISAIPSLIITSPPYYGMRTYVQDQWLRNWFLGGSSKIDYTAGPQLNHGGKDVFVKSLGSVWSNIASNSADRLEMYVRFGIIPSAAVNAKEIFRSSLEESGVKWRLVSVRAADSAEAGKRQAIQMRTDSAAAVEFDFHVKRI